MAAKAHKKIQEEPRLMGMTVEEFFLQYAKDWAESVARGEGTPYCIDIDCTTPEYKSVTVIGGKEVREYMKGKKRSIS